MKRKPEGELSKDEASGELELDRDDEEGEDPVRECLGVGGYVGMLS